MLRRTIVVLTSIVFLSTCAAFAEYTAEDRRSWPERHPQEVELLREKLRLDEGPLQPLQQYVVLFSNRGEFEAAWPRFVTFKSQGAAIILRRGPSVWLGNTVRAGIRVHTPAMGVAPEVPRNGNWEGRAYIELIVDGDIVDLNRIPLPPDTPIIDERFKEIAK